MFVEVKIFVEDWEILTESALQLILLWWRFNLGKINTFHCFSLGHTIMPF